MKILSHIKMPACAAVLCITVFCLSGCTETDTETLARIDALETRLNHVEELLTQAQNEREVSVEKLESMSAILMAAQSQIQELIDTQKAAYDAFDVKLSEITAQRDAAMADAEEGRAEIEKLNGQLTEQAKEIADFKLLVTDFKAQIADLQKEIAPPVEESPAPADTEQPKTQKAMVGFPETDPSVTVIRGPSRK